MTDPDTNTDGPFVYRGPFTWSMMAQLMMESGWGGFFFL